MYWIVSPCKDCTERYLACHDKCDKYKEYRQRYDAEQARIKKEKALKTIINNLNYGSSKRKEKLPEQLKHGRRPKK